MVITLDNQTIAWTLLAICSLIIVLSIPGKATFLRHVIFCSFMAFVLYPMFSLTRIMVVMALSIKKMLLLMSVLIGSAAGSYLMSNCTFVSDSPWWILWAIWATLFTLFYGIFWNGAAIEQSFDIVDGWFQKIGVDKTLDSILGIK